MSDESNADAPSPDDLNSLLGGLDFSPDWAREAPGVQKDAPRDTREQRRGPRAPGKSSRRNLQGVRVKPRRDAAPRGGGGQQDSSRGGQGGGYGGGRDQRGGDRGQYRGGGDRREGGYRQRPAPPPRLPVHVDFIPDKSCLSRVVKVIRGSGRVYPLEEVARMFMEKPAFVSVKFTPRQPKRPEQKGDATQEQAAPPKQDVTFYQCRADGMVFLEQAACEAYILDRGMESFFECEERPVDPPAGNFVCVGKHSRSGRLIGPPNWHGYQIRLEELRQQVAPGQAPEHFSADIEMSREEEDIEAWRTEQSRQLFYRRKLEAAKSEPEKAEATPKASEAPEATPEASAEEAAESEASASEDAVTEAAAEPTPAEGDAPAEGEAPVESEASVESEDSVESEAPAETEAEEDTRPFDLSKEEAEALFMTEVMPKLMTKSRKAIMPGVLLSRMPDSPLSRLCQHLLQREHRHPSSIIFALRPAFKHMRLELFRFDGNLMVSGHRPHPLPTDQKVVAEIQGIVDYVAANPGCNAKDALMAVQGNTEEPTATMVSHFHWLIEKGHLLELSNQELYLPPA